jgi:type III restriction enzyme
MESRAIPGTVLAEWEMVLFKNEELINYLTAIHVNKSVYEYVVYQRRSNTHRQKADEREDIKLFVKLPGWFRLTRRSGNTTRTGR